MNQDTKIFASIVDNVTKKQIDDLSNSDAYKGCAIRVMPDCHAGAGCTIGTVINIRGRIVPNTVGVDIGCGMLVTKLEKQDVDLAQLDEVINKCLDECRDGEGAITKVWNFYDNGGCWFNEDDGINSEKLESINDENWDEKLYEGMTHTAYLCLYIVVDDNGNERLKYYRFTNGGCKFDDDQAEPDHDYVSKLSLVDLSYIIEAIRLFSKQE